MNDDRNAASGSDDRIPSMIDANRSPLPHRFMRAQQRAVRVLERQVEVGDDGRRLEHRRDQRVADLARVQVEQPDPRQTGGRQLGVEAAQQRGERAGLAGVAPVPGEVLGDEHQLGDAALDERARLGDDRVGRPRALLATERWDRAERAGAVAALGDLDVGPGRGGPGPRQLEQIAHTDGLAPWRRNRHTVTVETSDELADRALTSEADDRVDLRQRGRSSGPDRSARQPVTTRRAPSRRTSASSRMVSTDSRARGFDERAGVHDDEVRVAGAGRGLETVGEQRRSDLV